MRDPYRKNSAIMGHLDNIMSDLEDALQIADENERETQLKSVLYYWLGVVFDDGAVDVKNFKTALDASRALIYKLKEANEKLRGQAKVHMLDSEEI